MARRGQSVVVRQTLSGSDYGLIDDTNLEPNPSYWASWLWKRLMGTRVLAAGAQPATPAMGIYAHCTPPGAPDHQPGAVTVAAVNFDPRTTSRLMLPAALSTGARSFSLGAASLQARRVHLGSVELTASDDGSPPPLATLGASVAGPALPVPPATVMFVVLPRAGAAACQ